MNNYGGYIMTVYHKHHIVPKHMGGTDDSSNLIELTVEEHAEAHRLLWEEHGNEYDRIAWMSLSGRIDCEDARILAVIEWNKNRIITEETRDKMSKSMKEYYNVPKNREKVSKATKEGVKNWWLSLSEEERQDWIDRCSKRPDDYVYPSGWNHTDETRLKMRGPRGKQNVIRTDEHKENISKSRKGKGTGDRNAMADPENRKKIGQSKIGRKRVYQSDGTFKYLFPNEIGD